MKRDEGFLLHPFEHDLENDLSEVKVARFKDAIRVWMDIGCAYPIAPEQTKITDTRLCKLNIFVDRITCYTRV